MSKKHSWGVHVGFLSVLCLVVVGLIAGVTLAAPGMPSSGEKQHMKLVGYNDLQGRETLQVTAKSDEEVGDWVFVGHHNRPSSASIHLNPLTGDLEENGTSILDISDPAHPRLVVHIPNFVNTNTIMGNTNFENRNSRSTSVVYDFMGSGKDYLIRNSEGSSAPTDAFEIFDITNITRQGGNNYIKVGEITGSPDGPLTNAHKGWWSPATGYYYGSARDPGSGLLAQHLMVWDLSNLPNETPIHNFNANFVGRGWIQGQMTGEDPPVPGPVPSMHHPIVDEANKRVYASFLTGGDVASFDISAIIPKPDPLSPPYIFPVKWQIDTDPPGSGTHTVTVIQYDEVPNFDDSLVSGHPSSQTALPRLYALVADEATGGDMWRFTDTPPGVRDGVRDKLYMFDVTDADAMKFPFPVETWQVPNGDYLMRGGRFGPHQFNETEDGKLNTFEDRIAYVAYFNAGVRAIDISDPYNIKEVGYYVPQENERSGFIGGNQPSPNIQINDVDTDRRGLIYASDRVGSGLFVLEFTGKK